MTATRAVTAIAAVALSCAGLAACLPGFHLAEPGTHEILDTYKVTITNDWSRLERNDTEIWTVDGPLLDQLTFIAALEDGDGLFDPAHGDNVPIFKAGMRANDIVDLVEGSVEARGFNDVRTFDLVPADFGALPGFRFRLAFLSRTGLAHQGIAVGAVDAEKHLHLVVYTAVKEYYFDHHLEEVERILSSIEML